MCAWVCGGSEEGGEEEVLQRPIAVAGGVWVEPQASVKHMR